MSRPVTPIGFVGLPPLVGRSGKGALAGVLVLDVTRVVAGPYCSQILGDLGATVIKVENPKDPDYTRTFPPFLTAPSGEKISAFFGQYNRGKLGMTINLATDEGKDLFRDLVKVADVLVENFRPGTMEKLGLAHTELRKINPRLVYTALSGFGQTGPYSRRPAYDNSAQASGGLWAMNGFPDREPVRAGTIIGDLAASMYGVIGTLAALRHAERTGEGQLVDISQQDSVISFTETAVIDYTVDKKIASPLGNAHSFVKPYELFPCKDGNVFFGGYTDKFWRLTCELFGEPDMGTDAEIDTMEKRFDEVTYNRRIKPLLDKWFSTRTGAELEQLMGDLVPLTSVKNIAEVVEDPHVAARDMIVDVDYQEFGMLRMFGQPVHLDGTPAEPQATAPACGEHTDAILVSMLGCEVADIAGLRERGAI